MAYTSLFTQKKEVKIEPIKTTGGYKPLFVDAPKITFTEVEKKKELDKYMKKLVRGEKVKSLIKRQSIVTTEPITVPERDDKPKGFVSGLKEGIRHPVKSIMDLFRKEKTEPMKFEVGVGLEREVEIKPGPRIEILEAIKRGEKITITSKPTKPSISPAGIAKEIVRTEPEVPMTELQRLKKEEPIKTLATAPIRFLSSELARFVVGLGLEKANADLEFIPATELETLFIGERPIKRLAEQSATFKFYEKELKEIGLSDNLAKNSALTSAIIVGAFVENPFVAGIGKGPVKLLQRSLIEMIEKETKEKAGKKVAERLLKKSKDLIKIASKEEREFFIKRVVKKEIDDITIAKATKAVKEVGEKVAKKAVPKIIKTVPERIAEMKKFTTETTALKATKAKSIIREKGLKELKSFEIPQETYLRKLQTKLQDKMSRLNIIQRSIKKSGKVISEEADAYLKAELYIGKASSKIDDFDKGIVEPILKRLKTSKIDADEFGAFLYAKHAPERNAQIAKFGKLTSGSGMTNKQADDVIQAFTKKGNLKEAEKIANDFYENITKQRLKILKESGLIDDTAIKKLKATYKNYVPLKGKEGVEKLDPLGQGFSIAGKDIKRAFGRESRAENPFVRSILDYQTTVMRAEKNKVAKTFLKLVEENPNSKLWDVEGLRHLPRFDKTGELISLDPKFKFADNVMQVRVDGKIKMITIKDATLAKAMKNLGQEKSIKVLYTLNNYLRSVNTVMNPEFILTNFERDLQTALINVGGEQSLKMAKNTAKNVPKAMKGIWKNIRKGDTTSEWGKIYQELKATGGKTGFFDYKSVEQKTNELMKRVKIYNSNRIDKKMSNVIKGVGNYINDANEVVEMAVRTSAYSEALKNGFTKSKAASLAKNLTVNFNTKGNWGTMLNTLYLFSNAGIQGSTRIIRALKHKNVRKIVAGITVGSFAINEMNRNINEEEYNKIEDWEKNSNLIFMMPNGNHINIRLPYGFNIFKILGDVSNEIVHGDITVGESFKRLLIALDDAYNPLSSGTLAQLLSPTLTDPIIQIGENKNWFGGPIKPDQPTFGAKKRESKLYWSSVRPQTKAITEWLNKMTGGSEIEAGFVDVSPENIDHLFDFMTGGVGKFIANSVSTTIDIGKGEFPELKNIPFGRQVIKEPSEFYASGAIREVLDKSGTEKLSEKDIDKFRSSLKDKLKKEEIDAETATGMIKDLMRNQAKIKAGRVFTEIKNASKEEKIKIISELNELEKKEFIKILKKQ